MRARQVSDGGVHSHIRHLYALLETAKEVGLTDVFIHFFGDGRDTAPRSAAGYLKDLLAFIEKEKVGYSLENMSRVLPPQVKHISFPSERYVPVKKVRHSPLHF